MIKKERKPSHSWLDCSTKFELHIHNSVVAKILHDFMEIKHSLNIQHIVNVPFAAEIDSEIFQKKSTFFIDSDMALQVSD